MLDGSLVEAPFALVSQAFLQKHDARALNGSEPILAKDKDNAMTESRRMLVDSIHDLTWLKTAVNAVALVFCGGVHIGYCCDNKV